MLGWKDFCEGLKRIYLVVVCVYSVEGGVDDGFDGIEGVKDSFGFVEVFPSTIVVA